MSYVGIELCAFIPFLQNIRPGKDWPSKVKYHFILLQLHFRNRNILLLPTAFKTFYDNNNILFSLDLGSEPVEVTVEEEREVTHRLANYEIPAIQFQMSMQLDKLTRST